MALTVTDRGTFQTTPGSSATNTITSSSFSPAAGSLLVVCIWIETALTPVTFSMSDTFTGTGAWAEQITDTANPGYLVRASIWTALAGGSPGTGTVTATRTAGTGDQWFYADAFEVTGQHSSPIGATGHIAGNGLSSPQSVTLSGAPASTSAIFGQIGTDNGPSPMFTPPSGWTEANEIAAAGGWGSVAETAFINTGGSTTFSWTSTSGAQFALVALEILVAAGVTDPYPAGYNPHIQQNTVYRL